MGTSLVLDVECISAVPPEHWDAVGELAVKRHGPLEADTESYACLCPPLARVVCIGVMDLLDGKLGCLYDATAFPATLGDGSLRPEPKLPHVRGYDGEAALLTAFGYFASRFRHLISFSGRGYDLPVLMHRAVITGAPPSELVKVAAREHRYHPSVHHDMLDIFTSFGASGRFPMRAYGIGYGLGDCKADGDGSHVAELVAAGEVEKLVTYCMSDVRFTADLYKRWANARLIPGEGRTFPAQAVEAVA